MAVVVPASQRPGRLVLPDSERLGCMAPVTGVVPVTAGHPPDAGETMKREPKNAQAAFVRLSGCVQHYRWGKLGSESLIAKVLGRTDSTEPFAELWFGAHEKCPSLASRLVSADSGKAGPLAKTTLAELIEQDAVGLLGNDIVRHYGPKLPFLMKLLSVGRPLSIQAHPDKALAAILHLREPQFYPDANHKPEIGVALTPVRLLCGFREISEIEQSLEDHPELAQLTGSNGLEEASTQRFLQSILEALLRAPGTQIRRAILAMEQRLESGEKSRADEMFLSLVGQTHSSDPGPLCSYVMNEVRLKPGEAIFIGPNRLHAYLEGEVFECMASSDNVVRAGLTEKHIDVATVLGMLDWNTERPDVIRGELTPGGTLQYLAPADEFRVELFPPGFDGDCVSGTAPEMLLCVDGELRIAQGSQSVTLNLGEALLVPAALPGYHAALSGGRAFRVRIGTGDKS